MTDAVNVEWLREAFLEEFASSEVSRSPADSQLLVARVQGRDPLVWSMVREGATEVTVLLDGFESQPVGMTGLHRLLRAVSAPHSVTAEWDSADLRRFSLLDRELNEYVFAPADDIEFESSHLADWLRLQSGR